MTWLIWKEEEEASQPDVLYGKAEHTIARSIYVTPYSSVTLCGPSTIELRLLTHK